MEKSHLRDCDVFGCPGGTRRTKGLCPMHYARLLRYGDPQGRPEPVVKVSVGCCESDCDRVATVRERCQKHYLALWRSEQEKTPPPSMAERLWSKIERGDARGCWIWIAGCSESGYGSFRWGDKTLRAHKAFYELLVEPVPSGLELDHLCENKTCVNPSHLEPVTHAENTRRASHLISVALQAKTHCPSGHAYTEDNVYHRPDTGTRMCRACIRERKRPR